MLWGPRDDTDSGTDRVPEHSWQQVFTHKTHNCAKLQLHFSVNQDSNIRGFPRNICLWYTFLAIIGCFTQLGHSDLPMSQLANQGIIDVRYPGRSGGRVVLEP